MGSAFEVDPGKVITIHEAVRHLAEAVITEGFMVFQREVGSAVAVIPEFNIQVFIVIRFQGGFEGVEVAPDTGKSTEIGELIQTVHHNRVDGGRYWQACRQYTSQ